MDKMREEFEKWATIEGLRSESHLSDDYFIAEKAWRASRAALVVKLPEYVADSAIRNGEIDEFKSAMDKAGIKYE